MRFKNRLEGTSFGYRDVLLNIKLSGDGQPHVGELQLHLDKLVELKSAAHKVCVGI